MRECFTVVQNSGHGDVARPSHRHTDSNFHELALDLVEGEGLAFVANVDLVRVVERDVIGELLHEADATQQHTQNPMRHYHAAPQRRFASHRRERSTFTT